jgi:hypothetical protein
MRADVVTGSAQRQVTGVAAAGVSLSRDRQSPKGDRSRSGKGKVSLWPARESERRFRNAS